MTNDTPPWEDYDAGTPLDEESIDTALGVCAPDGSVTQSQFAALLQMVKDLKEQVRRHGVQIAGFVNQTPGRANPPAQDAPKHEGGALLAGKYRGKTHDWVALNEPDYVRYLVDNNWHERWGFTAEHIEAAEKAARGKGPKTR